MELLNIIADISCEVVCHKCDVDIEAVLILYMRQFDSAHGLTGLVWRCHLLYGGIRLSLTLVKLTSLRYSVLTCSWNCSWWLFKATSSISRSCCQACEQCSQALRTE